MAIFADLGVFGSSSSLENEIEVLKSRRILGSVIDELDLLKEYLSIGERTGFQSREFYQERPIDLVLYDSVEFESAHARIDIKDRQKFVIQCIIDDIEQEKIDGVFGKQFNTCFGKTIVNLTPFFDQEFHGRAFDVILHKHEDHIAFMREDLKVETVNKDATVLKITYEGPVKDKNEAIINELIRQHELDKIADKNKVAEKTSSFIEERMKYVSGELSEVDMKNLSFKNENKLIDVETNAQSSLGKETEIEA